MGNVAPSGAPSSITTTLRHTLPAHAVARLVSEVYSAKAAADAAAAEVRRHTPSQPEIQDLQYESFHMAIGESVNLTLVFLSSLEGCSSRSLTLDFNIIVT